ncbi:MAG: hypothetical protein OXC98_03410 [bacterium]|nr:hypothetical protein [Acidimicrobiia bacterium]MCY4649398.1 hypothetical protein [bacterium]
MRTPLSTIKGSVETLLQESCDLHPAETAQFHYIILDQSNNMRHLIRDLLDVAQIETGAVDYIVKPFSPSELKARIEAALRRREAPEDGMPPEEIALGDLQVNFPRRCWCQETRLV